MIQRRSIQKICIKKFRIRLLYGKRDQLKEQNNKFAIIASYECKKISQ
jgi:hypothetical protein